MELYGAFLNLGIHFKLTVEKSFNKISLILPIMATAKTKFVEFRRKLEFWERREKNLSS